MNDRIEMTNDAVETTDTEVSQTNNRREAMKRLAAAGVGAGVVAVFTATRAHAVSADGDIWDNNSGT